jgi:hypothetical protein
MGKAVVTGMMTSSEAPIVARQSGRWMGVSLAAARPLLYSQGVQEVPGMKVVSVAEARQKLKALLDEVSSGHEISVVRTTAPRR